MNANLSGEIVQDPAGTATMVLSGRIGFRKAPMIRPAQIHGGNIGKTNYLLAALTCYILPTPRCATCRKKGAALKPEPSYRIPPLLTSPRERLRAVPTRDGEA